MGLVGTMIDFFVFNMLILFFGIGLGFSYLVFKSVSFICATSTTFFLHKRFTFKHNSNHYYEDISKFFLVSTFSFCLNSGISFVLFIFLSKTSLPLPLSANISVLTGILLATIVNFIGYKHYVFKKEECSLDEPEKEQGFIK